MRKKTQQFIYREPFSIVMFSYRYLSLCEKSGVKIKGAIIRIKRWQEDEEMYAAAGVELKRARNPAR